MRRYSNRPSTAVTPQAALTALSPRPMSAAQCALIERLHAYSLDAPNVALPYSVRLAQREGWSSDHTAEVIAEYKRFTFLAVSTGQVATPSKAVDAAWHLHLEYTREYWDVFCAQVLGAPLHHTPGNVATLALIDAGAISFSPYPSRKPSVKAEDVAMAGRYAAEWQWLRARKNGRADYVAFRAQLMLQEKSFNAELIESGWLWKRGGMRGLLFVARVAALCVAALGFAKICVGMSRDRPVMLLVFGVILFALAYVIVMKRLPGLGRSGPTRGAPSTYRGWSAAAVLAAASTAAVAAPAVAAPAVAAVPAVAVPAAAAVARTTNPQPSRTSTAPSLSSHTDIAPGEKTPVRQSRSNRRDRAHRRVRRSSTPSLSPRASA